MRNRFTAIILLAALAFSLCGCGSIFEKEYLVVEDYIPAIQQEISTGEKVAVKSFSALKQVIQRFVSEGREEGTIIFDSDYSGNASEDLASACWQIRTQNALCAYCVDNISYEVSHIVAHDEAAVRISYADFGGSVEDIVRLPFSTGADELILKAMSESDKKLELYILNGTYTAEGMENLVTQVYRDHPVCTPKEPKVKVNVYSGTGMQRLYEIDFNYGMSKEELDACREKLAELNIFADTDTDSMNPGQKALAACSYLTENCEKTENVQDNNVYSVLIRGCGNSEGLALAYVELCRELGLSCRIVYGQKDWESHCWNIVTVLGSNYHVDVSECIERGMENGFLLNDQRMWNHYRWDISSYPSCTGDLTYREAAGLPEVLPQAPNTDDTPIEQTPAENLPEEEIPEESKEEKVE